MGWAASLQCSRKTNLLLSAEQGILVKGQEGKLNALWLIPLLSLSLQSHFTSSHQVTPAQGGQSKSKELSVSGCRAFSSILLQWRIFTGLFSSLCLCYEMWLWDIAPVRDFSNLVFLCLSFLKKTSG